MNTHDQVEKLKKSANFIAMFKGSTEDIDSVISYLSQEEYHTNSGIEGDNVHVYDGNIEPEKDKL